MGFEWDSGKAEANYQKHGIRFEEAVLIFQGNVLEWEDERFDYGEVRKISVGVIRGAAMAVVVHTDRTGVTRVISARFAKRKERELYYERFGKPAPEDYSSS